MIIMKKLKISLFAILLMCFSCQKEEPIEVDVLFLQKAANISTVWKMDNSPSTVYLEILPNQTNSLIYYIFNGDEQCWSKTNYLDVENHATNVNQTEDILEITFDNGTISQTYVFTIDSITNKLIMSVTETAPNSGGGYETSFSADTTDLQILNYCQ